MIKKNWKLLLITSLMLLVPIAMGLILWNKLPDQIPTHWNTAGEVDGWSSKPFAVFFLPGLLLAIQWLCVLATAADPKKQNHPGKVLHLVFWFVPILGIILSTLTYLAALGKEIRTEVIMPIFLGLVFTIIGNYLPKCKQNYTIGIKIPWTLNNEENWSKTHRFAGWIWTIGGIVMMLSAFFGTVWILAGVGLIMVLAPVIYSYILHRKGM